MTPVLSLLVETEKIETNLKNWNVVSLSTSNLINCIRIDSTVEIWIKINEGKARLLTMSRSVSSSSWSGMVSSSSTICGTSPVTRSTEVNLSSPCCASDPYVPRSRQLLVLVMVIPPLIGNPFSDYIHPYDDLPPAHFWDFRGMASHVSSASTSPSAIGVPERWCLS